MPELVPDDDPFIRSLREAGIRPPRPPRGTRTGRPPGPPRLVLFVFVALFLLFVFLPGLTTPISDWLWFNEIGFERVFLTKFTAEWIIGLVSGVIAFAVLYGNARYAMRGMRTADGPVRTPINEIGDVAAAVSAHATRLVRVLALPWTALLALFVALGMAGQWNTALQAIYRTPFGQTDPIFGRDIGYYVFVLPAIETVVGFVFIVLLLSLVLVALPIHFARAETGALGENRSSSRPHAPAALRGRRRAPAARARRSARSSSRIPGLLFGEHLPLVGRELRGPARAHAGACTC